MFDGGETIKIKSVHIHNFRSIKDAKFNLYDYNVLVGANNSGKTNILTALRVFYEDDIKFDEERDFPKFKTEDDESWIEIEFKLSESEFETLKREYQGPGNTLRVRKYLKSSTRVKRSQSNIYAYDYVNGSLSENQFYGARNISQAKLGSIIYIPAVIKTDEALKLTGKSPMRKLMDLVMKDILQNSDSFKELEEAFEEFNKTLKGEGETNENTESPLKQVLEIINSNLKEWGVKFDVDITPITPGNVLKSLVTYSLVEDALDDKLDVSLYGQGLQRYLIYIIIKLSATYGEKNETGTKNQTEFSPDFTLILFEEPEAFLHPTQQEILNANLRLLSHKEGQQVTVTTHSSIFVSRNTEELPSLIKLKRNDGVTRVFQLSLHDLNNIFHENNQLVKFLEEILRKEGDRLSPQTKRRITNLISGDPQERLQEEELRYILWLDSERSSAFFADVVLICEGATEKILIDYLLRNDENWIPLLERKIYVLDAMGKFNIHRYMNLFEKLGINHAVLMDSDENRDVHKFINAFIENNRNEFTLCVYSFDKDLEGFLGIELPPSTQKYKKPLNVLRQYENNKIDMDKIRKLREIITDLISGNCKDI